MFPEISAPWWDTPECCFFDRCKLHAKNIKLGDPAAKEKRLQLLEPSSFPKFSKNKNYINADVRHPHGKERKRAERARKEQTIREKRHHHLLLR